MPKKLDYTPNSRIKSALRQLWLRSRERANAIKRDQYICQKCGRKQSNAKGKEFKVEVHHEDGICNWQEIFEVIRKNLLCSPDKMKTLCKECHKKVV
jgi:5-methylcytosine-specific restriction endonuclease McrA